MMVVSAVSSPGTVDTTVTPNYCFLHKYLKQDEAETGREIETPD
jgi:hypothetical protein